MKVFTYYENLGNGHEPLIELWAESWRANGWTPVVLSEKNILSNHLKEIDELTLRLPTVNSHGYERACYRRWAAMANSGGGWMSDYDVLNVDFASTKYDDFQSPIPLIVLGSMCVPCVTAGQAIGYALALTEFLDYQPDQHDTFNGKPHIQEMTILRRLWGSKTPPDWLATGNLCVEYLEPGWEKAGLIHFHTGKVDGRKYEIMKREWERLRKP